MVSGQHDNAVVLPPAAIEAIHRIRTDSGRLGASWYRSLVAAGLSEERYVELLSVVASSSRLTHFRRAAGLPPLSLPNATPGELSVVVPVVPSRGWPGCRRWRPKIEPRTIRISIASTPVRASASGGNVRIGR